MGKFNSLNDAFCCLDALREALVGILEEVSGDATLVAGTVSIPDTSVTATSKVSVTRKTIGGTAGNLAYSVSPGVGITITSSSATDTSTVTYFIRH